MILNNFDMFPINSFVIHLKHGLGQYKGLTVIEDNNIQAEYFTILYADNVKLYVPIHHVYLIKKYIFNTDNKKISLHKLGNKKWINERNKIFKNIQDIALNLLDNHAYRTSQPGFAFKQDVEKYQLFCQSFPYEMTCDQKKTMYEVLQDMNKSIPMDRLVCGDVGFGKTEIAIRASFVAVSNKKQVIILVPTTLLAHQHYKTFQKRYKNWPVQVDILSRFQSKCDQISCIENIKLGNTNILIATHKILFNNVLWYDLGLLIIDEEHRFGVSQKEKIKKQFPNIDILTLTATPIPRTLHMAMHGIRNLSILATPPVNRLPVKIAIKKYNTKLIREIIVNEIKRKGQVYYICNKITNLKEKLIILQNLIPEATFKIGHGKIQSTRLKKIMYHFQEKKFDVLICTTIIETGIDIPTVNSIIIEDADSFGLAQLYQMKGRVGRSNIQAYAWLLISDIKKISSNGKKRLLAIESIKNFGAGFDLSMHDLQIRGMGELLGYNQSGHGKNIEISLYVELLQQTIFLIKQNTSLSLTLLKNIQPKVRLFIPNILPESYISNMDIRLYVYKKFFESNKKNDLLKLKIYLIDNFGVLPQETENLFIISNIRILCNDLGIKSVEFNNHDGIIAFNETSSVINSNILLKIFESEVQEWKIKDVFSFYFIKVISNEIERITWLWQFLKKIKHQIK
ncbi:Transcription-repair-coupling factor [Buchnera aphidicola (Pterocallis alni)]|uniref:DEAD/DEAH box helicase n=1 Tax=Buchnera aphidicola TaxID=9 RepID=UPI003464D5C3